MNSIESLHCLTEAVEQAGADIAPTYAEYVQLVFAIATDCGEQGRQYFHRLCRLSPKYNSTHAERVYTNALARQNGEVHLGTAFHLAELAGVDTKPVHQRQELYGETKAENIKNAKMQKCTPLPAHTHMRAYLINGNEQNEKQGQEEEEEEMPENEKLLPGSEPRLQLPHFPEAEWPEPLMDIMNYGTSCAQRDVLLLGSLTALGASMERFVRCPYAGKYQSPCLQTFIVAPPASGKGVLSHVRKLVEPIHDKIREQTEELMKAYLKEKTIYDTMGKKRASQEPPQRPVNKMFIISGNNTGTGILQNIMDAEGTGFICETEADTISTAINADYGNWSHTLRQAFDHDRLSYNRRTDQEYREVKKSFLSVLLSGTPAQVKPLIPSAENGLFSRQLFYYMYGIRTWVSQFDKDEKDLESIFTRMGIKWQEKLELLQSHGIHTLRLTEEQKEEFDSHFATLFEQSNVANGSEMSSSVARLAVNICRIMSEVAVLRILENPHPYEWKEGGAPAFTPDAKTPPDNLKDGIISGWDIAITHTDFEAVLSLTKALYRHATHILSFLPTTDVSHRGNADRDAMIEMLGDRFTRADLLNRAKELGINPNTAKSWLRRLVKLKLVDQEDETGIYSRTHFNG